MTVKISRPATPTYHGPIGKCIYCGSEGSIGGLSKEHAVPLALDGSHVILRASCETCREITRKIEEINLKGITSNFGVFRVHDNYRTSHPRERPTTAPINVSKRTGLEKVIVPIKDRPPMLVLPEFKEPGILANRPVGISTFIRMKIMSGDGTAAQIKYGGPISADYHFKLDAFIRMLAKIVHSMAIATYGIDGFDPFLPDLILGKRPELAGYLVGQSPQFPPQHAHGFISRQRRRHEILFRRDPTLNLIAAGIQLFSAYPTPTYCVVVGTPMGRWSSQHAPSEPPTI